MSVYYPQAAVELQIIWEDFEKNKNIGPLASGIGPLPTGGLNKLYLLPIFTKRVTVHVNDYTQADTCDLEIDYKNFPFDPRCIRACGINVFMEDQKALVKNGSPIAIKPSDANAVFLGFADEESISFDDDHRTVKMECRDFTSILIDTKHPAETLDTTTPLDMLIQSMLSDLPAAIKIKVDNRTGSPLPTLSQFAPDFLSPQDTKRNPKVNESYWDVIQDLVNRAALIAYIELDTLVITKPRVLYNKKSAKQFIYGGNLKTLEFKRKLGRKKGFNIRCVSLNGKGVEEAKIPLDATAQWTTEMGITNDEVKIPQVNSDGTEGDPKTAPYISFRFPNLVKKQLIEVGQKIYEEVSRQQLEGSFTTKEMDVVDKDGTCFDVTDIRNGTPIEVIISQGDLEGLNQIKSVREREKFLISRCYEPAVAHALAQTLDKFSLTFYTKSVQFTVDQESGFHMRLDFINFIELDQKGLGIG